MTILIKIISRVIISISSPILWQSLNPISLNIILNIILIIDVIICRVLSLSPISQGQTTDGDVIIIIIITRPKPAYGTA